jgi:hypothetical protein
MAPRRRRSRMMRTGVNASWISSAAMRLPS